MIQKSVNSFLTRLCAEQRFVATCNSGGFPDANDCSWYHTIWPYLRAAECVSNPFWHQDFYLQAIARQPPIRAIVVGTADVSTPALLSFALGSSKKIVIVDRCSTPLTICHLYASETGEEFETRHCDLEEASSHGEQFDTLVNDAFLTRFPDKHKPSVVRAIARMLSPGGRWITTVRKGLPRQNGYRSPKLSRDAFVAKACEAVRQRNLNVDRDAFPIAVRKYIENMISFRVPSDKALNDLLLSNGFSSLQISLSTTPGESEESDYFRVIATV